MQAVDAVQPEVAVVLSRFAPSHQYMRLVEKSHRKRPHHPFGQLAVLVLIGQTDLVLVADGLPKRAQMRIVVWSEGMVLGHQQGGVQQGLPPFGGQHGGYFGQSLLGGITQFGIGVPLHPAHAQDQRFDFGHAKHQRRQHKARFELIADARFAANVRALLLQAADVAIQGAQADAQLGRQLLPADRITVLVQQLQELEQAFGSGHGGRICGWQKPHHRPKQVASVKTGTTAVWPEPAHRRDSAVSPCKKP